MTEYPCVGAEMGICDGVTHPPDCPASQPSVDCHVIRGDDEPIDVVWYIPETPYVVLVDTGSGVAGCIVYGPYGWLEAGRVADGLGGYARSVVSSGGVTPVQTPVSDSEDQVQIEHESP